ncbi:MAG: hypothetical protein ACR652_13705 [Methylocystis sp.]|uniref:hypothetical protein n=1 Tax=Methylocystis sp. TaxID=1911079 RepID=UPI003DA418D3
MYYRALSLLVAALFSFGERAALAQPAPPPTTRVLKKSVLPLVAPPLATSVHGFLLAPDGKLTKVTSADILKSQTAYIQALEKLQSPEQGKSYQALKDKIAGSGDLAEGDRVFANSVLIGKLLDTAKPDDEATIRARNQSLLSSYGKIAGKPVSADDLEAGVPPTWVKKLTFDKGDIISIIGFPDIFQRYSYSAQCKAAGVPVPPDWDGNLNSAVNSVSPNGWKNEGLLSTSYLTQPGQFPHRRTMVFSHASTTAPAGLCIALPIQQDTVGTPNVIDALGIICQGLSTTGDPAKSNSKACFWDNNGNVTLMVNAPYKISSNKFLAPPHLPDDNQCTDCHAGENAFITHPGSPIQKAKDDFNNSTTPNFTSQNNWYAPMVQPTWPTNPEAKAYPDGNGICGGCHNANDAGRLPNVSPLGLGGLPPRDNLYKFCAFLLPNVLTTVSNPATFDAGTMRSYNSAGYAADIQSLYNACKNLTPYYFPANTANWLKPVTPP